MANEVHVGDINTEFRITILDDGIAVDVSGATTKTITIKRPDGTSIVGSGSFYTDGTDGIIYYRAVAGDLNQSGTYKIQAYVVIPAGSYYSSIGSFPVKCNL